MTTLKTIILSLIGGLTIGGIWDLQEYNYYLGTIVGIVVLFGTLVIVSKKGN